MNRLNTIITRVLQLNEKSIRDDLTPNDVEAWDSLNALILVAELERVFEIRFTLDDIQTIKCIGDIRKQLAKHGIVD